MGSSRVSRHEMVGSAVRPGETVAEKPNVLSQDLSLYIPRQFLRGINETMALELVPSPPSVSRAPYMSRPRVTLVAVPKSRVMMVWRTHRLTSTAARMRPFCRLAQSDSSEKYGPSGHSLRLELRSTSPSHERSGSA